MLALMCPQYLRLEPQSKPAMWLRKFTFDLNCCPVFPFGSLPHLAMN